MNIDDIKSMSKKAREDGRRLFGVCEFLYFLGMIGFWIIAIIGAIGTLIALMNSSLWVAVVTGVVTIILCLITYATTVLSTHFGKVLVHTSFSCLGILENVMNGEGIRAPGSGSHSDNQRGTTESGSNEIEDSKNLIFSNSYVKKIHKDVEYLLLENGEAAIGVGSGYRVYVSEADALKSIESYNARSMYLKAGLKELVRKI